jgi:hypothetical protein
MKIGRNEPCWCGSGKKFKKCHLGKETEDPLKTWEVSKELRDSFSSKYCLAPKSMQQDCSGNIIRAHTIAKSGSLKYIARDGHVYAIRPSIEILEKTKGMFEPQLIGINQASTFTGFCSKHDNDIFFELEKTDFQGTSEQCFLLGYRTVSRELFMKASSNKLFETKSVNLAKGRDIEQQKRLNLIISGLREGIDAGLRDIKYYKSIYDDILISKRFNDIRSYQIHFDGPPPIMASGSIFPEYDFEGNLLQDLTDVKTTPHIINFTSFFTGIHGAFVFSWIPQCDAKCNNFIESLDMKQDKDIANYIIRFLFEYCENLCISPDWWENKDASIKVALQKRMVASCNFNIGRKNNCLCDDGIKYDLWKVVKRKTENV